MWEPAVLTLALMTVAVAVAAVIGVLLGLAAGLSDRVHRLLRPVLDTMQVLPAFAYLLPFVLVFGIGTPAALFSTVIYAAPPMARLTALGLRGTDRSVLEASASLGAGPLQRLLTVRIPLARKDMLLGLNQTIMMALSMVVIAALVGAGGLGEEIYQALSTVDVGQALAAGIPIVLIAIWLDRTTAAAGARLDDTGRTAGPRLLRGPAAWARSSPVRPSWRWRAGSSPPRSGRRRGRTTSHRPSTTSRTRSSRSSGTACPSSAAPRCGRPPSPTGC